MPLKPGQVRSQYSNSMAEAMEQALRRHWPDVMPNPTIPFDNRFLRLFFVAIAQGVVRHLEENHDSFKVEVSDGGDRHDGQVDDIETQGVDPAARS